MPQLKAYHRPANIAEALRLLAQPGVRTAVLGGGTYVVPHLGDGVDEVVDLQAVGLTGVSYSGDQLTLGAMVRLQTHAATLGGVVVGADRESELLAALLVFAAEVHLQSLRGSKHLALADFLLDVPAALDGGIVTAISLLTSGTTASDRVARTPEDRPIVAAVARRDPAGQLRLALCGVAQTPVLVDPDNVKASINPPGDFRGSSAYRRQMAATLAQRVIHEVGGEAR
jgi:CO/xanthine dehydrogenase FAD-binding subunit